MDKIGDSAQDQVGTWASNTGITVNTATRDRYAWDLKFEFPRDNDNITIPFDKRSAEISCLVQVKGIIKIGQKRKQIKLSNMERFAKSTLPCFFVIVEYGEGTISPPTNAFIIHVDEKWMSKILKRLRKESAKPNSKPLHDMKMDISWTEDNQIPDPKPLGLADAIKSTVGDPGEYTAKKMKLLEELGYEDAPLQVNLSFHASMDMIASHAVGLIDELPAQIHSVSDVRFGIPTPHSDEKTGECTVKMVYESNFPSRVTIYSPDWINRVSFDCITKLVPPGLVADEFQKALLSHPFLSVLIEQSSRGERYTFDLKTGDLSEPVSLKELAKLAKLILIIDQYDSREIEVEIDFPDFPESKIRTEFGQEVHLPPPSKAYAAMIEQAWSIAKAFNVENIQVVPNELLGQSEYIRIASEIIDPHNSKKINLEIPVDDYPNTTATIGVILTFDIDLGQFVLTAFTGLIIEGWQESETGLPDSQVLALSGTVQATFRSGTCQ